MPFILAFLPIIIFIEGFVSIAIEILTIRQLLPVAGGSVIVTSLVIGIFLLFLALGYKQGGQVQDNLAKALRNNFFIAAIWMGIGLSYAFISLFFFNIEKLTGPHVLYPLLAYLLLIIAPLIYLLGQTLPITMNMVRQNKSAGTIGGNALGLSTLGSFLGATFTTLVLMYFLGVAWTVFINFLLLVFLYILLSESFKALLPQACFAIAASLCIYALNIKIENTIFVLTNNYANYEIRNHSNADLKKDEKILVINNSVSSFTNKTQQGFPYIEMIKKILFNDMQLRNTEILVIGAGGFSLSTGNNYGNHFTYVDIDKQIKKVTVPGFIKYLPSELIGDDGRHYLQTTQKHFQIIVVDAYSNVTAIPSHLLTREYMQAVQRQLQPQGTAIFNIIANPTLADAYSKRIDNTLRSVFSSCMAMPLTYKNQIGNIIYLCSNGANLADRTVYTDNLNTAATDYFDW